MRNTRISKLRSGRRNGLDFTDQLCLDRRLGLWLWLDRKLCLNHIRLDRCLWLDRRLQLDYKFCLNYRWLWLWLWLWFDLDRRLDHGFRLGLNYRLRLSYRLGLDHRLEFCYRLGLGLGLDHSLQNLARLKPGRRRKIRCLRD
ncbi:MAG: hypothetical protein WC314_22225, partial [Vulcanimicrobiota bacterium]